MKIRKNTFLSECELTLHFKYFASVKSATIADFVAVTKA